MDNLKIEVTDFNFYYGNIHALKKLGYKFIDPVLGKLACGYSAVGHLAGIDHILKTINTIAK